MKQFLAVLALGLIIIGCTKGSSSGSTTNNNNNNNNNVTCTGTKSFASDVSPIFQSICSNSGCHDAGSTNGPGPLVNYQQIFNARASIRAAVASGIMPKNTSLTAAQKNALICWIDAGASDN
jgi:hypothetical protein